jgi:hypothetical protein
MEPTEIKEEDLCPAKLRKGTKDLRGEVFGMLTVLRFGGKHKEKGRAVWQCRCDCGKTVFKLGDRLQANSKKTRKGGGEIRQSCGCNNPNIFHDLKGQKFGYLTVVEFSHVSKSGHRIWLCRCKCGEEKSIIQSHLENSHTSSCGCFRVKNTSSMFTTHGASNTSEYAAWRALIGRLRNDLDYAEIPIDLKWIEQLVSELANES